MSEKELKANAAGESYNAESIQVLEGLEAVRKRPSMYIGDIGERGLHHLVYEVVYNSIDEALAGFCNEINVTINEDNSITVSDNGRGIPTGMHEKEHRSALEVVLTILHAGGKFNKGSYKVSGGLHGVGVSCVNALSIYLKAEIHREGKIFVQEYSKGKPTCEVKVVGDASDTGTTITFRPDPEIFTLTTVYNYETLATRLRELAFLNKKVKLTLTDKRAKDVETGDDGQEVSVEKKQVFYSEEGLKEFVAYLDGNRTKAGVNVGLAVGTSLSSYSPVYLESGLYFVQKGGESKHGGEKFTYGLDYLEIPLVFKYKAPVGGDVTIEPFLGGFVSCGVSGEIKDFQHRQAYSSFSDDYNDNFRRFDGGLRIGCGLSVDMFYIEAGYDLGLANVGKDYFDDTHTGALNLSVGINF